MSKVKYTKERKLEMIESLLNPFINMMCIMNERKPTKLKEDLIILYNDRKLKFRMELRDEE